MSHTKTNRVRHIGLIRVNDTYKLWVIAELVQMTETDMCWVVLSQPMDFHEVICALGTNQYATIN